MTPAKAVTIALWTVGGVVGFLVGMVTAFYIPTRPVSVGVVATVLLIGPYAHFLGRALRSPAAAALPGITWLVAAMTLGSGRAEGDLVIPGTTAGVAFLLLGTISCVVGIGTVRNGIARSDRRAAERAAARAVREAEAEAAEAPETADR